MSQHPQQAPEPISEAMEMLQQDEMLPPPAVASAVQSETASVHSTVRRNVSATMLARVGYMVTRILIPPFVLARIGLDAYGIWSMVFILVSYVGISTLGISNVYIKYVAEFNARREYDRINSLLSTGLAITLPMCSAIFVAIFFGWPWIAPFLHLPAAHAQDGRDAVLIVLGVFLASISLNAFSDTLTGMQEIAAAQTFWTLGYLVEFAAVFTLVGLGFGLRGLAEAYLLRVLVNDGLSMWWAWRRLPWLRLSPRRIRREVVGYVLHFGGMVQLQSMLSILLASIEKVIALFTVGLAATGLFDIAKKWPSSIQTLPMAFFGAFLPAASHLDAHASPAEQRAVLRDFYLRGSRYSNLCTSYFCGLMAAIPGAILAVWLGPKNPYLAQLTILFLLFTLGTQMHLLTGPGTSILRGMGRVYDEFFYSVPNLLLLCLFVPASRLITGHWTTFAIGVAVFCATAGASCVLLARVQRVLGFRFWPYARMVLLPSVIFYAAGFALRVPVTTLVARFGRWPGMGILIAAGLVYTALSGLLLDRFILHPEERRMARQSIRRALSAAGLHASGAATGEEAL
ncbi:MULTISPECIES: hypothetical protein [Acidobacterium]|nr:MULTISPECIES: hypothetical protein [Acidobacterium]HCT60737.1 hypothetical protein [Acidobacterium sp.]